MKKDRIVPALHKTSKISMIRAEGLKMRHTFSGKLPIAAAALTLNLVLVFAYKNKYYSVNAWNWWYVMMLPGMLAILCCMGVRKEKKLHYCNLLSTPVLPEKYLTGQICFYALGLGTANLLVAAGTFAADFFWGSYIPAGSGFAAAMVLSVCFLWEIPFFMLLGLHFSIFVSLFSCMVLSVGGTAVMADSDLWWLCPAAIPVRLMCPVLGIMPNGLLASAGSPLLDTGALIPGIVICLVWFAVFTRLLVYCFYKTQFEDSSVRAE